jgi:hypothetical protein
MDEVSHDPRQMHSLELERLSPKNLPHHWLPKSSLAKPLSVESALTQFVCTSVKQPSS